jgi:hypothetical protein
MVYFGDTARSFRAARAASASDTFFFVDTASAGAMDFLVWAGLFCVCPVCGSVFCPAIANSQQRRGSIGAIPNAADDTTKTAANATASGAPDELRQNGDIETEIMVVALVQAGKGEDLITTVGACNDGCKHPGAAGTRAVNTCQFTAATMQPRFQYQPGDWKR